LLDTDAIIDYLFGIPASVSLIQGLHEHGDTLCVCDVVIAEVYAGLRLQHREAAEKLLSACTFLPTSAPIARHAGSWRFDFARKGVPLATTDCLVAATAHAHGATILTGNTKDYPMLEITLLPLERAKPKEGGEP
ncbi:MAG: PIN domain-containing protein, partial [Chloroflexi bacterium]|nr:PIN domain-containing protein [Chloroflexota bacterium]